MPTPRGERGPATTQARGTRAAGPPLGRRRPGGRTAQTRAAVFDATLALLAEGGFTDLSVEAVAARAGVHKTTVYRRWGSVDRLVVEAFMASGATLIDVTDTGDIDRDVRALARTVVRALQRPELGNALRAMLATTPPDARQHIAHQYWASRAVAVGR